MRRSRLTKRSEKKTKNTIFLSLLGIVVILFLFFKFGVGILVNFSLFLSGKNQDSQAGTFSKINYVSAPVLNPLPTATNSAHIVISGNAASDTIIHLYINGSDTDEVKTDKKGIFTFSEELKGGNNEIKAKAQYKEKQSDFSDSQNVLIKNTPPMLDLSYPADGDSFKKDQNTVKVSGKTDAGASVTVNGFWAVIDENNNFSYNLTLQNGDNQIKVIALDSAGNRSEKSIKVNYSQ